MFVFSSQKGIFPSQMLGLDWKRDTERIQRHRYQLPEFDASLPSIVRRSSKAETLKVISSSFSELNQNLQSERLEEAI